MSFTDDFTNAGSTQDLAARSGWTRVDGTTLDLKVSTSGTALDCQGIDETAYQCTSQGSADHYSQAVWKEANSGSSTAFLAVRVTTSTAWIGVRHNANGDWQLYKNNGGYSLLGSYTASSTGSQVIKVEASGNTITVYIDGVSRISVTESFNNTEVRQGLVGHAGSSAAPWIDDFVASAVGATGGPYAPTSDVTVSGWTSSAGGSLYATIDEASFDDADYIVSPTISVSTAPATFGLAGTLAAGNYTVGIRAKTSTGTATMRVYLLNGSNVSQGVSADQTITSTFTTYSLPVTTTGSATRAKIEIVT